MTSQVNPNNIDGTYPVAGQDNDSQGFRDNFTNIRNNFTYVKAEIEDIQNKAVFKSALTNTTLANDMSGNALVGASFTSWRETYNNIGAVSGAITVDFANADIARYALAGTDHVFWCAAVCDYVDGQWHLARAECHADRKHHS